MEMMTLITVELAMAGLFGSLLLVVFNRMNKQCDQLYAQIRKQNDRISAMQIEVAERYITAAEMEHAIKAALAPRQVPLEHVEKALEDLNASLRARPLQ